MSYAGIVGGILRRYGQTVTFAAAGARPQAGRALLRPLLDEGPQFAPTRLGERRRERFLCLAEAGLALTPQTGLLLTDGEGTVYDVVSLRPVTVGSERAYWRAVLERREEEEAHD